MIKSVYVDLIYLNNNNQLLRDWLKKVGYYTDRSTENGKNPDSTAIVFGS